MQHQALTVVYRRESGRVLAALARLAGLDAAEDALHEAWARALRRWPREGMPESPGAWLHAVARNLLLDGLRRHGRTARGPEAEGALGAAASPAPDAEGALDAAAVPDERLRLLFTACHPALSPPAQVALTLRALCGLETAEIARALLEPEATTAQRIVRAKRKIAAAGIPYALPRREDLPERLAAVLAVVYLVFNEGYLASRGPGLVRLDLCHEAIGLARVLAALLPDEPEVHGLLALVLLHDARREARTGPAGELVPLEEQDRTRWDRAEIAEGLAALDRALALGRSGPYQIQAAVAALHATAATPGETDWRQIALLYGALERFLPTPTVALNAAAAAGMALGPEAGLARLDALADAPELAAGHLLPAARADLLRRAGRPAEAAAAYREALSRCPNERERAYLARRLGEVAPAGSPAARRPEPAGPRR
jgi:RNA polymerase sigma-70 factor (ECF subfamily)